MSHLTHQRFSLNSLLTLLPMLQEHHLSRHLVTMAKICLAEILFVGNYEEIAQKFPNKAPKDPLILISLCFQPKSLHTLIFLNSQSHRYESSFTASSLTVCLRYSEKTGFNQVIGGYFLSPFSSNLINLYEIQISLCHPRQQV